MSKVLLFSFMIVSFENILCEKPIIIKTTEISEIDENLNQNLVDISRKEQDIRQLINRAEKYIDQEKLTTALSNFTHNNDWRLGEIFIFVLDDTGTILCHGTDTDLIGENITTLQGSLEENIFKSIQEAADKGGGWIDFILFRDYKSSYVKKVNKNDVTLYIGAGFFPESKTYFIEKITKKAVDTIASKGTQYVSSLIQNPFGPFVKGDISLFLNDFNNNVIADPIFLGSVGQNMDNLVDQNGRLLGKQNLRIAKSIEGKGWVDAKWRNEPAQVYIHSAHEESKPNNFYLGSTNYTNLTRATAVTLVRRAISHLKSAGYRTAFESFNSPEGNYVQGPMAIFVYDFEGKVLANGEYAHMRGQNDINRKDKDGRYYVKDIIEDAKKYGKGIITHEEKNDYKTVYFESIDSPDGKFIIGTGFFPSSKEQSVENMVNKGAEFLSTHNLNEALDKFNQKNGEFFRGDINLFVYKESGVVLVSDGDSNMIWQNIASIKNDKGQKIITDINITAKGGGGWLEYTFNNIKKRIFVKAVNRINPKTKQINTYIIGAGYHL